MDKEFEIFIPYLCFNHELTKVISCLVVSSKMTERKITELKQQKKMPIFFNREEEARVWAKTKQMQIEDGLDAVSKDY